jgi:hypothetical protein
VTQRIEALAPGADRPGGEAQRKLLLDTNNRLQ